ncbi:response regulator transcription factor [Zunongwangia sp. F363]|uniref:Response regulator transcription factor n=1 Tax=Autumnicola tepida TaxID=3075595 RepID=A0ABU3C9V5_9FLAO|nr:response regulator transcription factor [Zunongwangia sp. F363]MDT0643096.1 response regulator transcription factor [Zunongwangia sp. F363]
MNILVVEDEPGIAGFIKQGLEEESFFVEVVAEGRKGLDRALSNQYDLIILDWMIPGISGIEICRRLRDEDKETPVIFLTAKDTVEETIFGLQAGANDYIKKPFHFQELLERIKVQLRPKSGEHMLFTLGPVELNTGTHQVFKNGEEVSLTFKEFALLEFLIRNKERVCTRTRIIEKVWDINFSYNTGVIDVYINALRKKLKLGQDENYIQTVRGLGYIAKEI